MKIRLSLRKLVDVIILVLFVIAAWRIIGVRSRSSEDLSLVTPLTPAVKPGDILRLPGVDWSTGRTVVLVVSSTCPSCNADIPFYRQLGTAATPAAQVVAVSAEGAPVISDWFRQNEVDVRRTYHVADPLSHGLTLTPMVLIVNAEGRVTDLMIRKLTEADRELILERVRNPSAAALDNSGQLREISTAELQRMGSRQIQLLDVRSRDHFRKSHRPAARNVPAPELKARARIELNSGSPIVLDCLQPRAVACRSAGWTLVDAGFADVSLLIR